MLQFDRMPFVYNGAYPEGSGVKAGLLCVGEFSGNIICGYPSGQGLGSELDIGLKENN